MNVYVLKTISIPEFYIKLLLGNLMSDQIDSDNLFAIPRSNGIVKFDHPDKKYWVTITEYTVL